MTSDVPRSDPPTPGLLIPPQQPLTPQTNAVIIDEVPKQCFCFLLFELGASDHVAHHFRKCSIADELQSSNNNRHSLPSEKIKCAYILE
jgi:hypothetical protein